MFQKSVVARVFSAVFIVAASCAFGGMSPRIVCDKAGSWTFSKDMVKCSDGAFLAVDFAGID